MKVFSFIPLMLLLAFAPAAPQPDSLETVAESGCSAPLTPQDILYNLSANPFEATATYYNTNPPPSPDGYEWTITHGYIVGGQGTATVKYLRSGTGTVTLCVRAFNVDPVSGERCYSGERCESEN